jgi:two-component system sensor histidine kinase KdpD
MKKISEEKILACITSDADSQYIIAAAHTLAEAFHESFAVLHVGNFTNDESSDASRKTAEEFGARYMSIAGGDLADLIVGYARESGAEKIVIGRPKKQYFSLPWKETPVQKLLRISGDLEIYFVPQEQMILSHSVRSRKNLNLKYCLITAGLIIAATLLGIALNSVGVTETNIVTLYILSVLFIAFFTDGYIYSIFASVTNVFIFNYFFTEPKYTFFAYETGYPLTFLVMGAAAILTSSLTIRGKEEEKIIAQKAYRTDVLLNASRSLQHADTQEDILWETAALIVKLTNRRVVLYPVASGQLGRPLVQENNDASSQEDDDIFQQELPIASWVFNNHNEAGAGTDVSGNAKYLYMPIYGSSSVLAVAGLKENDIKTDTMDKDLLQALLTECGFAMEREQLRQNQNRLEIEAQREKTRSNLLRAISHDLRTPLTSISGNSEVLLQEDDKLDEVQRKALYKDINDDAEWLINVVENILLTTRMDNKSLNLNMQPEAVQDLIDEAVSHMTHLLKGHTLIVEPQEELWIVKVEASLMIQVFSNLIDNAVKYSPANSEIRIAQERKGDNVLIHVMDEGPGISDVSKKNLFTMFYTAGSPRSDSRRGLGIGLSLCRTIVDAHGGRIYVENNHPHGSIFTVSLPLMKGVMVDE